MRNNLGFTAKLGVPNDVQQYGTTTVSQVYNAATTTVSQVYNAADIPQVTTAPYGHKVVSGGTTVSIKALMGLALLVVGAL